MPATLSVFTPSLASYEDLERSLVVRGKLLDNIMWRIRAAATSPTRSHTLLVGPRGSGKTHLIALAYHRTRELVDAGGIAVQTAWLPEDPWAITTYERLLAEIIRRLEPPADEDPKDRIEAEAFLIRAYQKRGPIVVFTENLDKTLVQIEDLGQQRLRHMAQEGVLLLVASATQLTAEFEAPIHPFFWFFTTDKLKPFTVDEAAEMLIRIAEMREDEVTAEYLRSDPKAMARLRTVQHLAGGQPRVWALLANAMTAEGLDDLIDLLLTKFDDLTPYYQEQLARLSPRQREVVVALVEADRALNVKDLATAIGVDQRSLSKTMTELRDRGWVTELDTVLTRMTDRRLTYYELAEPLARLAFQIKDSRGTPVRLVVDFLKSWFEPQHLADAASRRGFDSAYVAAALSAHMDDPVLATTRRLLNLPTSGVQTIELLARLDHAVARLSQNDPEPLMRLPAALRAAVEAELPHGQVRVRLRIHREAQVEYGWRVSNEGAEWLARASSLVHEGAHPLAVSVFVGWLACTGELQSAAELVGELQLHGSPLLIDSKLALAEGHLHLGSAGAAASIAREVVEAVDRAQGSDHPDSLYARGLLAASLARSGEIDESVAILESLVPKAQRVFGDTNVRTMHTRAWLAMGYAAAGRQAAAATAAKALLVDLEPVVGRDHEVLRIAQELVDGLAKRAAEDEIGVGVSEPSALGPRGDASAELG